MPYFDVDSGLSHIVGSADGKMIRSVCGNAHAHVVDMRLAGGHKVCMLCVRKVEKEWRDRGIDTFLGLCDKYGAQAATERLKEMAKKWKPIGG